MVVCAATGVAVTGLGISDTNADGLGVAGTGYTRLATATKSGTDGVAMFVRNYLIGLPGSTNTTWNTSGQAGSTGGGLFVYSVAGVPRAGVNSVRIIGSTSQVGVQQNGTAATAPAPALPAAALTTNGCFAVVFNGTNPAGPTAPTGFTRLNNSGYGTPAAGLCDARANSGITTATFTFTSNSASAFGAIAVEFDISTLSFDQSHIRTDSGFIPTDTLQSVNRSSIF